MKPLAPNSLIQNRYLVVQLIGKGGMGDVYLAVDQRLGSAIALKRTFFSEDENLSIAFEREAKMLARLRHPVLPKVSDHFTEGETQFLVMEHISGDDLSHRLEQNNKPFPLSWVLFWADQLLDALSYLHSHEPPIIHRDIKPQNLKLTNENHIILLDFGLAKNSGGETRLSTTGDVVAYTPNYASMEQIRGTGTTARSDIYSLSATMYQLLSTFVPPDALSRADDVLNNQPDPVTPLYELNDEVSPAVSNVIMRGMSLSSEQRYATARDMQIALREAYSQVQTAMSAQTVAFSVEEELNKVGTVAPQSDIKTVAFSTPLTNEPVGEKTEVMPLDLVNSTAGNVPVVTEPTPNLEATVAYVPPASEAPTEITPVHIPTPLVGEKTEVMPFDLGTPVGEKTEVIPIDVADITTPIQNETANNQAEQFNPDATVPFVAYTGSVQEVPTQETAANFVAPLPVEPVTQESVPVPVPVPVQESVPVQTPPEPKKKAAASGGGGGKMFAIIGILLALGVLGLAAVGGGIYVFKPELLGLSTPTPKPSETPVATPSVTPSPEPTLAANNNSNSNSGTDLANTNSGNSNMATVTPTPEIVTDKPTGDKPTFPKDNVPTPTPRVATQTTPGKVATPKPQPTKTTSKTPSRTDVLQ